MEALILVATRGGPTMFARIGVMRALNRNVERVFNSNRKDSHWGKRKPARTDDQSRSEPQRDRLRAVFLSSCVPNLRS